MTTRTNAAEHFDPPSGDPAYRTNDELFELCNDAMTHGRLSEARAAADELCRPERASKCVDLLVGCRVYVALDGYTDEQLKPLQDRIDQYNAYVNARSPW